ncbi:hypothetical protein Ddc_14736 [Ditylenchus destructor]|nr:hypothetical protein Ddc_14736 [Ditylenchus destructor]
MKEICPSCRRSTVSRIRRKQKSPRTDRESEQHAAKQRAAKQQHEKARCKGHLRLNQTIDSTHANPKPSQYQSGPLQAARWVKGPAAAGPERGTPCRNNPSLCSRAEGPTADLPEYKVTKKIGLNKCFKKRCTRKQHCKGNCKFCNSVTKLCTLYKGRVGKGNSCTDNRDCRSNKCRMPQSTGKILLGGQTGACEPSPGTSSNADLNDLRQQIQAFAFTKQWRLPNYLQNPEFDIEGVTRPQCPMYYFGPRPQCTSFSACVRRGEGLRSLDGVRKVNEFEKPIQE